MADPVRWGVLGCARIAINHVIPAMLQAKGLVLLGVASRTLSKAQDTAKRFVIPRAYGSYEALLADPDIEAVYIPLPNHLHKPWAIAAVQAGKHVLCEKPIGITAAEARDMQAVAKGTGRILLEAFAYRFGPTVQRAISIARCGTLGELRLMHSSMTFPLADDPSNVRLQADIGGGALYDVGCYAINVQRMLAGREPLAAWTHCTWSEKYKVDMAGAGVLDYGDGLRGTFDTGFNAPGGSFLRAVGTAGKLEAPHGFNPGEKEAALVLTVGAHEEVIYIPPANGYVLEVQDLSEAIRGQHAPLYGLEPLDATMRVIDACYAAARSGRMTEV